MNLSNRSSRLLYAAGLLAACLPLSPAISAPLATVDRNGAAVAIEPYAPNVVRVTIALDRALAEAAPGPGPNAKPAPNGWTHRTDASGDVFASSALRLTVKAQPWPKAPTQSERYFLP